MEGNGAKSFLVAMVILCCASALAHGQEAEVYPDVSTGKCAKKCALRCLLVLISPGRYPVCFGLCLLKCKMGFGLSDAVYNCTSSCANSMLDKFSPDAEKVGNYIDSCYESCKA